MAQGLLLLLLSVTAAAGAALPGPGAGAGDRVVMPWMCLEDCGGSVATALADIVAHRSIVAQVSFVDFRVGPNASFIRGNVSEVNRPLLKAAFIT